MIRFIIFLQVVTQVLSDQEISDTIIPRDPIVGNGTVVVQIGDELLTTAENEELFGDSGLPAKVTKRKAAKSSLVRWTDAVVPYMITNDFSDEDKKVVKEAMDLFEKTTCLRFRPSTDQDKNKIIIHNGPGGCVSMLGMIGGSQNVDLSDDGCHFFGLYLHELGHALGLIHEQQRPDRHKYVRILWRNVKYRLYPAYEKENELTTDMLDLPYDLSSVMQYELSAFAKSHEQTLYPVREWQSIWPARVFWKTMSITDVMALNKMYKCSERCKDPVKRAAAEKKCGAIKWKNAFIDEHCNCITPEDHMKRVCVNKNEDDACFARARKGDCQKDAYQMNVNCRRACGSCPLYGTKMAKLMYKKYKRKCTNKYWSNKWCAKWAAAGDCEKYPWWMKRFCAKACKACKEGLGKCINLGWGSFDNQRCDEEAKAGKCKDESVKEQCGDSCKSCYYNKQGDCENIKPDDECERRAAKRECDKVKTGPDMMTNCAKTCNSCWFNKGKCDNKIDDKKCEIAATLGKCLSEPLPFKKQCPKACNSCGYGEKGKCKNIWPDGECDGALKQGRCDTEGGYYKIMCASSCNSCDRAYGDKIICENLGPTDADCNGWAGREECAANPSYMTVHCAKACETCYKLNATACYNHFNDRYCQEQIKSEGGCNGFTNKLCRKECKLCQPDPGDKKDDECKDLHSTCKKWANEGECDSNPIFMKGVCAFSCSQCKKKPTVDFSEYTEKADDDYSD